jgi:hypothetical protein
VTNGGGAPVLDLPYELPAEVRRYFLESAARNYAARVFLEDPTAAAVAVILHRDGAIEVNVTNRHGETHGGTL